MKLTSGEFDLLWLLALHAGQELARSFLYEQLHSADWPTSIAPSTCASRACGRN